MGSLEGYFLVFILLGGPGVESNIVYNQVDCSHSSVWESCGDQYVQYQQRLIEISKKKEAGDRTWDHGMVALMYTDPEAVPFTYMQYQGQRYDTREDQEPVPCLMCHAQTYQHFGNTVYLLEDPTPNHEFNFTIEQCQRCHTDVNNIEMSYVL